MKSNRGTSIIYLIFMVALMHAPCLHAQQGRTVIEGYDDVTKRAQTVGPLSFNLFGDSTNIADGATVFEAVDVVAQSNSGLPMSIGRKLAVNARHMDSHGGGLDPAKEVFGSYWDLDVPYIRGVFAAETGWVSSIPGHRCRDANIAPRGVYGVGNFNNIYYESKEYWGGNRINIPGYGEEDLLGLPDGHPRPIDGRVYYGATKSNWRVSCVDTLPGEGYLVTLPNGTSYKFDWMVTRATSSIVDWSCRLGFFGNPCYSGVSLPRVEVTIYATLVSDRYGNWVGYDYDPVNPHRLNSVTSSDGASINVSYNSNGKIEKITRAGQSWNYTYDAKGALVNVVLPDASRWGYSYANLFNVVLNHDDLWESCDLISNVGTRRSDVVPASGDLASIVISHPSGATGDFRFRKIIHGTNFTPGYCNWRTVNIGTIPITYEYAEMEGVPMAYQVVSIYEKSVSGGGMSSASWGYKYEPSWSWSYNNYCAHPRVCGTTSSTVITSSDGTVARYKFGNDYQVNAGQLLEVKIEKDGVVHSVTRNTYLASSAGHPFKNIAGVNRHGRANSFAYLNRPIESSTVERGNVLFSSKVNLYDAFARPASVSKSSSIGYAKTDLIEYHDFFDFWVIGQPKRTTNVETGAVVSEVGYNTLAQPIWIKKFGKLQQTLTYNTDGTLATVADGRGNVTSLSNWKRGIPQLIRHPATPEAPAGATESATVNDNGWITSVTDENGYVTGYGYDAMGRLASIVQPTGDSVAYHNTLMNFRALTDADWKPPGVASGQWRLYEETGSRATITYMDALWRPVLKHEYDAANVGPTLRAVKTGYDTSGRVSFQSYPSSDMIPGASGIRTFYDALDRVTRVEQDSEWGVLATTTEYLAGLKTRVTNPRGFLTTTSFMAWDQPGYDLPILSEQPEGKVIEIARHPQFGWPQQLKQRNTAGTLQQSRQYVYDTYGQLCKTIEPETGATVMDYDAAGNLSWSAAGLIGTTYTGLNDCSQAAAGGSGRVTHRAYDARNRLTNLAFPNGRGNQVWSYTPDGLPASITTYNETGTATPVVNGYSYNRRRLMTGESIYQAGWYNWATGYGYDAYGHLSLQTYHTGLNVDYAPNVYGQPTKAGTFASGAQYYPNGALKQFTYGNGIVHTMTQNARQLPVRVTATGNAMDYDYAYDPNGNVERIYDYVTGTPTPRHRWMGYDGLDRLTSTASAVFGGTDNTHRFTYDALDNMTSWKLAGVKDYADYVYDASTHRLTNIRNTTGATVVGMDYDEQGNLRNKNGQAYEFDYGNRLRNVPGKESYRYDGHGRRVLSLRPDGSNILSMYGFNGQVVLQDHGTKVEEHIYLAGSIVATRVKTWATGGTYSIRYQHTDALGSPVAVSNEAGQVIERNDYEPYGAIIGKPSFSGIGYIGHVMDGTTGLTYMQQRYYDESVGRFLSVDPVTANSATGVNFNRYRYAANNPYRFIDPDGRQELARNANGKWELLGVEFEMPSFLSRMVSGEPAESAEKQRIQRFVSAAFKAEIDAEIRTSPQQALDAMDAVLTASIVYPGGAGFRATAQARRVNELREMLWLANIGRGNFGIGNASLREVMAMGRAWVGDGYRVSSNGKAWLSRDGFRQFRLPSKKNSKYAPTGIQANFESRNSARGGWQNNAHLNVEVRP